MMMLIVFMFKLWVCKFEIGKVYVCYLFLIGVWFLMLLVKGSFIVVDVLFDLILNSYVEFGLFWVFNICILNCSKLLFVSVVVLNGVLLLLDLEWVIKFIIVGFVLMWNFVVRLCVLLFIFLVGVELL